MVGAQVKTYPLFLATYKGPLDTRSGHLVVAVCTTPLKAVTTWN